MAAYLASTGSLKLWIFVVSVSCEALLLLIGRCLKLGSPNLKFKTVSVWYRMVHKQNFKHLNFNVEGV